ncbi:MAG: aminopeptidase N C-terminal domain-containing protein, partial [Pseudomonadota bacterium]
PDAAEALDRFHSKWQADPLVVDKWLMLQASAPTEDVLAQVKALTEHQSFDWKNPNKFRSLIGVFAMANPLAFHAKDGSGYAFVTNWLLKLDALNPQTTARLAGVYETCGRYTADRQDLMRAQMQRMADTAELSKNTREIVERMLAS